MAKRVIEYISNSGKNRSMFNSFWYKNLTKPMFSPPDWVFPPMWGFLYLIIIVSLLIYFKSSNWSSKKKGYFFFGIQMILNLIWSPVFFGLKNMLLALVIVILMDVFVILTIREFYKVSKISGILLVPYLLWILFATYLNAGYLILN